MGDVNAFWKENLNVDLKNSPFLSLPPNAATFSEGQINGQFFLQIEELTNVLVSSLKQFTESGKRLLKIKLTDGKQTITGVEMEKLNCLSMSNAPGTKVVISGPLQVCSGFWLFCPNNLRVIGGIVPHMLKNWEIHRDIVVHGTRLARAEDRPPWIPFGQKQTQPQNTQLKFRAMDIVNKHDEEDTDDEEDEKEREFALHRQKILSEAKGNNKFDSLNIGPIDRRPPKFLQITQAFMSAEEPAVRKLVRELPRDARDLIDKSDPGVEPTFRARGRGRGRGGGRRGRRGRGRGSIDDFEEGNGRPQRTANLMDFVTHQLGNMHSKI